MLFDVALVNLVVGLVVVTASTFVLSRLFVSY